MRDYKMSSPAEGAVVEAHDEENLSEESERKAGEGLSVFNLYSAGS
jgi:hypothetical protein